jgi:hypothetical protein
MDSTGFTVFDLDSHNTIFSEPQEGREKRLETAKAILQETYKDFSSKE